MKLKLILAAGLVGYAAARGADLRIGIIGCDTSHVEAFTETLNNPNAKDHVAGGRVVGAFKGGSGEGLGSEDVGLSEIFAEVDGARPVFRAGEDAAFDDEDGDFRLGEGNGGGDTSGTCSDDDNVVFRQGHDLL